MDITCKWQHTKRSQYGLLWWTIWDDAQNDIRHSTNKSWNDLIYWRPEFFSSVINRLNQIRWWQNFFKEYRWYIGTKRTEYQSIQLQSDQIEIIHEQNIVDISIFYNDPPKTFFLSSHSSYRRFAFKRSPIFSWTLFVCGSSRRTYHLYEISCGNSFYSIIIGHNICVIGFDYLTNQELTGMTICLKIKNILRQYWIQEWSKMTRNMSKENLIQAEDYLLDCNEKETMK